MAGLFGGYGSREEQIQAHIKDSKKKKSTVKKATKKEEPAKKKNKKKPIWLMTDDEYKAYMRSRDRSK